MYSQKIDVLSVFPDAKPDKKPNYWKLPTNPCPVCNGKDKLSISEGASRLFIKCWKECDPATILSGLAISQDALYYPREPKPDYTPRQHVQRPSEPYTQQKRSLSAKHYEELNIGSGISPEVIKEMDCWTETNSVELEKIGFSEGQSKNVHCLIFPCANPSGQMFYQMKPEAPFRGKDGKMVKYMTQKGGGYGLGVLPSTRSKVLDASIPLWVTEGAKKAGAAVTRGLPCIYIHGVWMWQKGKDEEENYKPLPDWESIPLDGRTVYLAFDSDAMSKEGVHCALKALRSFLMERGAVVKIAYLPEGEEGGKCGLDDFFVAGNSVADLMNCVEDKLRPLGNPVAEAVTKTIAQKLKRLNIGVSATGFSIGRTLTVKDARSVACTINGVESSCRNALSWMRGDLYLNLSENAPHGALAGLAEDIFRHQAGIAQRAASVCKEILMAERRPDTDFPFYVWEFASRLERGDQRNTFLDTCENGDQWDKLKVENLYRQLKGRPETDETEEDAARRLKREAKEREANEQKARIYLHGKTDAEIDVFIRRVKGITTGDNPRYLAQHLTREAQSLHDLLPMDRQRRFERVLKADGTDRFDEWLLGEETRLRDEEAKRIIDSYPDAEPENQNEKEIQICGIPQISNPDLERNTPDKLPKYPPLVEESFSNTRREEGTDSSDDPIAESVAVEKLIKEFKTIWLLAGLPKGYRELSKFMRPVTNREIRGLNEMTPHELNEGINLIYDHVRNEEGDFYDENESASSASAIAPSPIEEISLAMPQAASPPLSTSDANAGSLFNDDDIQEMKPKAIPGAFL